MNKEFVKAVIFANLMEDATKSLIANKSRYGEGQILPMWLQFIDACQPMMEVIIKELLETKKGTLIPIRLFNADPDSFPGENIGAFYDPRHMTPTMFVLVITTEAMKDFEEQAKPLLSDK